LGEGQFALAFDEIERQRRNTEVRLTQRWSEADLKHQSLFIK